MPPIVPIGLALSSPLGLIARSTLRRMSRRPTTRGDDYGSRLATNLRALIDHQAGGSVNAWATARKLPQSTINKIANGSRGATVGQLEEIADAIGYAPWQLLHPEFAPATMPPMMDAHAMRVAAIYAGIADPALKLKAMAIMEQFDDHALATSEPAPTPLPAPHQGTRGR